MLNLLIALQVKHLVIDWILQPPYMWKNKGKYGHLGGILHAAFNALGTTACFALFGIKSLYLVLIIDFLAHYHIDWAKMNLNRIMGWGPDTHPQFWWLTGLDQFLHQITYLLLIACIV